MCILCFLPPHFLWGYFNFGVYLMKKTKLKKISVVAMLCAVAYLCMFLFKFKVSFLTFDFKDAILAVSAFLYGPIWGMASAIVVAF